MTNRALGIAGIGLGALGLLLLVRKAKAAPELEPGIGDERIVITQISAKQDETGVTAIIKWKHSIPGLPMDAAFVEAQTSIGRMENGGWINYYTVGAQGDVPMEGRVGTIFAFWDQSAVAIWGKGMAGVRCQIVALTEGWQEVARSPWYVAEDVIEIK